MSDQPNTDLLRGMRCPNCGSYGPFNIRIKTVARVYDDSFDIHKLPAWNGDSYCRCEDCDCEGDVDEFTQGGGEESNGL